MNLPLIIYFAEFSDKMIMAFIVISLFLFTIIVFTFALLNGFNHEDEKKSLNKKISIAKKSIIFLIISAVIFPSSATVYLMLGASIAEDAFQGVQKSEIYNDAMDILKLKLKDMKEDLIKDSE